MSDTKRDEAFDASLAKLGNYHDPKAAWDDAWSAATAAQREADAVKCEQIAREREAHAAIEAEDEAEGEIGADPEFFDYMARGAKECAAAIRAGGGE